MIGRLDMNPELRVKLRDVDLGQVEERLKGTEYRKLVQQHLRKIGAGLELALSAAIEALTDQERQAGEGLIDEYNKKGCEQDFWGRDCASVLKDILSEFSERLSQEGLTAGDKILFNMFEIITLNFALHAHRDKELRKFMSVRMNWMFR
jgi:hypothetical protein